MYANQIEYILKACLSVLPVFVFFTLYYRNFVFVRSVVWQSKSFFLGMLSSLPAILIQMFLPDVSSPGIRAFVYAALVEESIRFCFLYVRIRNSSHTFSVMEGTFDGILMALGFAFAENLHYSVTNSGSTILLRLVSSVPVHVFASGLMAYFLSYRMLCRENRKIWRRLNWAGLRRTTLAITAFIIPVLYHGFFDYCLFRSGSFTYLIVGIILGGYGFLEYLIAHARLVPGKNILGLIELDADEMEIIQRQKEYDRWMAAVQDMDEVSLFSREWSLMHTLGGIVLLLVALFFWISGVRSLISMPVEVRISLTVLLPLMIGLLLILKDRVNFLYFREHMLRIPLSTVVSVTRIPMDSADETETEMAMDTIVLDILPRGVFLPGLDLLAEGERVRLTFLPGGRPPVSVEGRIRWANVGNSSLPIGALFQFLKPEPGFRLFSIAFNVRKFYRRFISPLPEIVG